MSCRVAESGAFQVTSEARAGGILRWSMTGTIDPVTRKGTARATLFTEETLALSTADDVPCSIDASVPPLEFKPGTLFATFDCDDVRTPPDTQCAASGVLVLEFCDE